MVSADMTSTPKDISEIFHRTQKCRFFGQGKCTRGSACRFAHTSEELRPRFNLACTKLCPTLLKTGSCTVDRCTFAHRAEDLRRKLKQRRHGSKEETSTGQFNVDRPRLCLTELCDASPVATSDTSMSEARLGAAKVGGNSGRSMLNVQAAKLSDDVALAGSVKDAVFLEGVLHHGLLVSVKNTFIAVDDGYVSSSMGLRRTSSAPGYISSMADIERSVSI
eukprot:TRINITY_DN1900_c0_g1_i1.p1 TRINITY_DN1900_c0_g1~~TRINITY_DN1900_c0_g1_i1.p1  ORF type:complete len:221 (-),score=27.68 TRINITY_DN1900_c0_g1_i1:488-1150(-)